MKRPLKVLILGKSDNDAGLILRTLNEGGFELHMERADSLPAMRAMLEKMCPDVVFCEHNTPNFDIRRPLAVLREADADIPLLVVSGTIGEENTVALMRQGAADLILKSNMARLLPALERELAAAAERRARRTALKEAEQAILEREAQLHVIAENLPGIIFRRVLRPDGTLRYTYMNPGMRELYGIEPEEFVKGGKLLIAFVHPADQPAFQATLERSAKELAPLETEMRLVTPRVGTRWLKAIARPRRVENGDIVWDGVALDVTELKETEAHRDYLAYYDQLTGLPNQALLIDRLSQALIQAKRTQSNTAVICVELTSLGDIRDSWGLAAADSVTQQAAVRLQSALQSGDTVAHIGGGHFYAVLNGIEQGTDATTPIREVIETFDMPFTVAGKELYVKPAIGISIYPDDDVHAEALLRNATTALDRAKTTPGQSYEFYNSRMTHHAVLRLNTERELRQAIEKGELDLCYQPQVHPHTFAITGMEALLRWHHPTRGSLSPAEFIPMAEQNGLIIPLGEYALRMACTQTVIWRGQGICPFPVAVNVSGWQLMQEDLHKRILSILEETGLPPDSLTLELTESTILRDVETVARTLNLLAAAGVTFAVDDFGIEHSALSHLSQLPLDTLKVDHSFVSQMTKDPAHAALVQAIISMTHAMHKNAVAEGVETMDELTYLRAYQVDAIQGYLFSRPVPPDQFEALLRAGTIPPLKASSSG